jgi:LemA protein
MKALTIFGSIFVVLAIVCLMVVQPQRINNVPKLQERVKSTWGQVENVYQRRMDLIPNLVEVVKGYATHERETLIGVIEARAKATQITVDPTKFDAKSQQAFLGAQDTLGQALGRLLVSFEKYPDLKADRRFAELQSQLEGTENRIAVERKRYVEAVEAYNIEVRTWPGLIWARLVWDAQPIEQFKADAGASKAPTIKFSK